MRVSWNWLGEFVELSQPPETVAERLTLAGLEVESVEYLGRGLDQVVAAEVLSVTPVEGSAQAFSCQLAAGNDARVSVLAPFAVEAGRKVALALPGAQLPRAGEAEVVHAAEGMPEGKICTEADLQLTADDRTPLYLPMDASPGTPVTAVLPLEDTILDIAVTPNRGDCLSILGIAREVAALTGQHLRRPRIRVAEHFGASSDWIQVAIAPGAACHRYVARVLTDVAIQPSPLWLQYRLRAVGLRPINNVVDVTNYVMWERGQPLHAFDYDRLPAPEITVRHADTREEFVTLDGETRVLEPGDLLITSGGRTVALAGLMGGANTEVSESTRRVLLESAWFSPRSVRRAARRLGLKTEASYRFERGVDVEGVAAAADRAAALFVTLCGARAAAGKVDIYPRPYQPAPVALRLGRTQELLGFPLSRQEVSTALRALGFEVAPAPRGTIAVTPPSYRLDIEREIDVVEEAARVIGYERIPETLLRGPIESHGIGSLEGCCRELRRVLRTLGLFEAIPLAFASSEENADFPGLVADRLRVGLQNPLSREDAEMRLSLLTSLVRVLRHNLAQGLDAVPLFLLGKVFWRDPQGQCCERVHLAGIVCPRFLEHGVGWRRKQAEFVDIKGVVETVFEATGVDTPEFVATSSFDFFHPGQTAAVAVGDDVVGVVGGIHPRLEEKYELISPCWAFELDLEKTLQYRRRRFSARSLPRFPAVKRDLAIVVDEGFAAGEIVRFVRQWGAGECNVEAVELVDRYMGPPIPEGRKSLTYSVWYRSPERTLTDAEVNEAHAKLTQALLDSFPVRLR